MKTGALNNVLNHLQVSFQFDTEETHHLLSMLHSTLLGSAAALLSGQSENVYNKAHTLHSELHICGHETLSTLAMAIEVQAKKGIIEQQCIDAFLLESAAFASEIERWLIDSRSQLHAE
jgi:HPt (histidine-containing phosphotransfer) domain-containing protein